MAGFLGGVEPSNKGKVYVYKDDKRVAIGSAEVDNHLKEGWQIGYAESPTKGKIWVYHKNEDRYTLCDKLELQNYIDKGWIKKKWSPIKKGSVWINKDGLRKRIDKELLKEYLISGWNKGKN
jgi:hypothetical protein